MVTPMIVKIREEKPWGCKILVRTPFPSDVDYLCERLERNGWEHSRLRLIPDSGGYYTALVIAPPDDLRRGLGDDDGILFR
jgi:hypothetical protein